MFDFSYMGTKMKLATPTGGHEIRLIIFVVSFREMALPNIILTSYVFVWFVALRPKQQLHVWS